MAAGIKAMVFVCFVCSVAVPNSASRRNIHSDSSKHVCPVLRELLATNYEDSVANR